MRADFVTVAVRTGGPGAGGVSLLVVEKGTPGFSVDRSLAKMGWHCSDTAELGFAGVRVPVANLVGAENTGFAQIAEQFVVERIALAVHGYGIAARSLALTAAYVRDRQTFGRPLVDRQVVRHRLVEMHRRVEVARTYVHAVATRHVAGEDVVAEACLAKQTAVEAAGWVCDQAVQLHGGAGYLHGSEVERHYRDARILPIGGGATEVLTDLAARLLGYGVMSEPAKPCSRSWPTSRPRSPRPWPGVARSTSSGTTPAASCCPASGSSSSSTRGRRSWSCRPWRAGARTSPSAPRWSPASAWSRAWSV